MRRERSWGGRRNVSWALNKSNVVSISFRMWSSDRFGTRTNRQTFVELLITPKEVLMMMMLQISGPWGKVNKCIIESWMERNWFLHVIWKLYREIPSDRFNLQEQVTKWVIPTSWMSEAEWERKKENCTLVLFIRSASTQTEAQTIAACCCINCLWSSSSLVRGTSWLTACL